MSANLRILTDEAEDYLPAPETDASGELPIHQEEEDPIDKTIRSLYDDWNDEIAIAIGKALTQEEGDIEDLMRRNREDEKRRATRNAFRIAYWVEAAIKAKGEGVWYRWATSTGATTLDQHYLLQRKSELLRVHPDLRATYTVYPSVYAAASLLKDPGQQRVFLDNAEDKSITARQARTAAKVMRDTNSKDFPTFTNGGNDALPDEPKPLTELWARLVDALDEGRTLMITRGVPETDAYDWWDRHYKHCQQCLRPGSSWEPSRGG